MNLRMYDQEDSKIKLQKKYSYRIKGYSSVYPKFRTRYTVDPWKCGGPGH